MTDSIGADLKQIQSLDSQKKTLLAAFLFVLFVVSIMVGANLSKEKKTTTTKTALDISSTLKPKTRLALSPISKTLKVGSIQKVSVDLLELPVTATDIVLTYDPAVFAVSNVQNGTIFERVLVNKNENGSIMFSAAVSPSKALSATKGTILSFTVRALKETPSSLIQFDTQKTITALNGENTLGLSTEATYKVEK